MYYELKWIEWPSGEEWFGIANTKEQIEEMIEDAANDEECGDHCDDGPDEQHEGLVEVMADERIRLIADNKGKDQR